MNNFETLRQVGVKEVARKTHIEPQIIALILDKNYEALAKYNVCGHIKIIVREFDVDMDDWLAEYAAAVPNSQGVKSCGAIDKIPPFTDSAERDVKPAGRGLVWLGLLIFVVAIFVYFFSEHVGLDKFIQNMQNKSEQSTDLNLQQIEQAKRSINETSLEAKPLSSTKDTQSTQNSENDAKQSETDKEINQDAQDKMIQEEPAKSLSQPSEQDDVKQSEQSTQTKETNATKTKPQEPKTASLKTLKKVWVGIINLNTKSKKSYDAAASREFEINLNEPQLIVAGNGNVNLIIDGKKQSFNPTSAVRLLVKDGTIKQINYDEFVLLNGGKSW